MSILSVQMININWAKPVELLVVIISRLFAAKPAANKVKNIQSVINSKLIHDVLIMHTIRPKQLSFLNKHHAKIFF